MESSQPAQVVGKHFTPLNSAGLQPGSQPGPGDTESGEQGTLTSSDTGSPMVWHVRHHHFSLCSSQRLLHFSPPHFMRVSTVLSSAVPHSSGGCISGN